MAIEERPAVREHPEVGTGTTPLPAAIYGAFGNRFFTPSTSRRATRRRCAQPSAGWVDGNGLRCFYHGWRFGPDGACLEQPAEGSGFHGKVAIGAYRACNVFQNLENALDMSDIEFVHHDNRASFSGIGSGLQLEAAESAWGVTYRYTRPDRAVRVQQFGMPVNIGGGVLVTGSGCEELNVRATRVHHSGAKESS
jgi:hypothetical protein